jgi:drug/metabolite transporter (DMT)-like permease
MSAQSRSAAALPWRSHAPPFPRQLRPIMTADNRRRLSGAALVLLSAFAWSVNGLYARLLTIDIWTTLAGRAIATALALFVALAVINRGRTWDVLVANTRRGIWVILLGAVTMIAFVAALFKTTVANVTVIYSISPLMAAVLARFLIGDRLVARTLLAFAAAIAGVVVIVGGSFGSARLFGDFLALVMSTTFAFIMVEMRRKPDIDNTATSLLSSVLLVLALWPIADLGAVTGRDAVILFLFGITSNVLGFFSFIAGVRRIPPAEAGLIATIEVVLAPLWVWLFFGETPGKAALIGGAIVLAAILAQILGEIRRARAGAAVRRARVMEAPQ